MTERNMPKEDMIVLQVPGLCASTDPRITAPGYLVFLRTKGTKTATDAGALETKRFRYYQFRLPTLRE